ncbi:MAG TPA: transglutaminase domain-containing protein, partial [Microbacterium sp.]|uniref:transglutaminase domain-containing protein n=1 Tax=Microbacterium sp. TaxID=51671 RepID=UPI002B4701CC
MSRRIRPLPVASRGRHGAAVSRTAADVAPYGRERRLRAAQERRAAGLDGPRDPHLRAAVLYAVSLAVVGGFATWPIYASPVFVIAVTLAGFGALVLAVLTAWRGWAWPAVVVGAALIVLVVGLLAAAPPPTLPGILLGVRDTATGVVTGFKDLVTVDLPVGGYRNLLVPAIAVFTIAPLGTVLVGRRRTRVGSSAVVFAWLMPLFGLLFGRTVTSLPVQLGPVSIAAPREQLTAVLVLVCSLVWLAWRVSASRRRALQRAAEAGGIRWSRRRTGSDVRRTLLAAAMVLVAVTVASAVAPAIAQDRTRDVLRSATGPRIDIARAATPLTDFRTDFSDAVVDRPLFTVTALDGALPDRVRLATLSWYDGVAYRVAAPGDAQAEFVRVPQALPAGGTPATLRIAVQGLTGIWMPSFGQLQQVQFDGPDAASLADSFYYDPSAQAAVETAQGGLRRGDAYTMTAGTAQVPVLSSVRSPHASPQVTIPASVKAWVGRQDAGTDGAALQTLVDRLRARGYLSHALSVPAGGAAWEKPLGAGYTFQPSAAGHSLGRIDVLFQQLLGREQRVGARPGASLVAAVGDEEQFAVATALVAQTLGFPVRVVVGARLRGDGGLPSCARGVCRGGDLTAWTEVQASTGEWIPVDVTPQHTVGVTDATTRQRDPENATDVRPSTAQQVVPPDPVQRDAAHTSGPKQGDTGAAALWAAARIGAIG